MWCHKICTKFVSSVMAALCWDGALTWPGLGLAPGPEDSEDMRRRIKDCQWLTCPRKGHMVLNNSFHSREADPHVIKNPPSGNGCVVKLLSTLHTLDICSLNQWKLWLVWPLFLLYITFCTPPPRIIISSVVVCIGWEVTRCCHCSLPTLSRCCSCWWPWWRGAGKLCPVLMMTSDEGFLKSFIFLRNWQFIYLAHQGMHDSAWHWHKHLLLQGRPWSQLCFGM